MTLTRRRAIAVLGGGVILAADLARARTARAQAAVEPAIRPWITAGTPEGDPRRRALSYAILAPSPHNRQPWLVDLSEPDAVTLLCDLERRLPETDPFDRQVTIGLGCFLELLVQAAAEDGLAARVEPFPEGEPAPRLDGRPVARVRLEPGGAPDPLFAQVLERRSNKAPYDMARPVEARALAALARAAVHGSRIGGTVDAAEVAAMRAMAIEGMRVEMATPETAMESVRLLRLGRDEVNRLPDGIDLASPEVEDLLARGVLSHEAVAAEMASGGRGPIMEQMAAYTVAPMEATPAYLWQTTDGNARAQQIAAGRDWVRVNLAATGMGLGLHPQSQTLQEFDAMAALHRRARQLTGANGARTVQMLSRLGHGPEQPPSPRWPAETRVVAD